MENPATWSELHHKVSKAMSRGSDTQSQASEILKVLGETELTANDIAEIIDEQHRSKRCGLSIPAQIVSAHNA